MFNKEIYSSRRKRLLELLRGEKGIAVFIGNVEAPAQYKDNCYKFRQDSTWIYYWGIDEPRFAATIDLETGEETIYADDVTIDDIIWMGPQPTVASLAAEVGVANAAPYAKLDLVVSGAIVKGRPVHTIPPSRYYNTLKLQSLSSPRRSRSWTPPGSSARRCTPSPARAYASAASNRRSWAKWRASPSPEAGAYPSPPSSPSTAKSSTTTATPSPSFPAS